MVADRTGRGAAGAVAGLPAERRGLSAARAGRSGTGASSHCQAQNPPDGSRDLLSCAITPEGMLRLSWIASW